MTTPEEQLDDVIRSIEAVALLLGDIQDDIEAIRDGGKPTKRVVVVDTAEEHKPLFLGVPDEEEEHRDVD